MNTFLSSAQQAQKDKYATYAKQEIEPVAVKLESRSLSLKDVLKKLGRDGYLGMTVEREFGGQGGSLLDWVLFAEAVGEFEPGLGLTLSAHISVVELLRKYGSETQKSRYLPLLQRGEVIGAFALNEDDAGSDCSRLATTLAAKGGKAALSGEKIWVVNGSLAGLFVVAAKESDSSSIALYLVDGADAATLKVKGGPKTLGLRSAYADEVEFAEHPVAEDEKLSGDANEQISFALDVAKTILAASSVGLVKAALTASVEHARVREQFGKTIGQFQGVQWKLADMSAECSAARLLTYRAAVSFDENPDEFRTHAAMCKLFASRTARLHSGEAIQVLATKGISEESPLERFYRDAKLMEICQGTSEIQKVLISDELKV